MGADLSPASTSNWYLLVELGGCRGQTTTQAQPLSGRGLKSVQWGVNSMRLEGEGKAYDLQIGEGGEKEQRISMEMRG